MLRNAAQRPNNNANPSGLSEKNAFCVESLQFLTCLECTQFYAIQHVMVKLSCECVNASQF